MADEIFRELYGLDGQVAVVTGGTGVLGGAMALGLARAGAKVAVLGRKDDRARELAAEIDSLGSEGLGYVADVLDRGALEDARDAVLERWGRLDILVNGAGGNVPEAVLKPEQSVFDMPEGAFREVFDLNLVGTVLPSQVFGAAMVSSGDDHSARGCIVNISSVAANRPLTNIAGYSGAKGAVENYTRWLAVQLARKYGEGIRVNAIAPGFFITHQNRKIMLNPDGSYSARSESVLAHTPAGRFGEPEELVSALLWLCGPGASFVTGAVIAVDGGFTAFGGV